MHVYGFTPIVIGEEGGASIMRRIAIGRGWIEMPISIITPEPDQRVEHFSIEGNPAGVIVKREGVDPVWVFVLHGRLFATRDLDANPHELWLSWAYARPHFTGRWTGLKRESERDLRPPVVLEMDSLLFPEEGKSASGNLHLDAAHRKSGHPIKPLTEKLAIFPDRMYTVQPNGEWRSLDREHIVTAQKLILAAAA